MTRRLAYLGPQGTFAEEAALKYDRKAKLLPLTGITAAAGALEDGRADESIVPIENSLEGSVTETLDLLINPNMSGPLAVRSEVILRIVHYLLVKPGVKADQVRTILSHPQALAQCRGFIESHLPEANLEASLSTAAAVQEVMARQDAAAIGTRRAGERYGAEELMRGIQDRSPNYTRFVVLAREDHEPTGDDKTSLAFSFAVEDRPGLLVATLEEFAQRSINLSKIESRPSKERLGTYIFLADVGGHRQDSPLAEALAQVEEKCSFFRVLGSYPRYREAV